MQTSNTDEMVTISRAEYEALKKENQSLETKAESLEAETEKLKDELQESEQKLAAAYLKNDQLMPVYIHARKTNDLRFRGNRRFDGTLHKR